MADAYAIFAYHLRHRASVEATWPSRREGVEIQARIEAKDPPEGLRATLLGSLDTRACSSLTRTSTRTSCWD